MKADKKKNQDQPVHDYEKDVQYQNAVFAIRQVETNQGGLTLREIWEETEKLRMQLREVEEELRANYLIDHLPIPEKVYHSKNPVRTQMCVLMLFGLRLTKADRDPSKNPHTPIIDAIVRFVEERAVKDTEFEADLCQLMQTINRDGEANEARGNCVEFGVDILAPDPEWCDQLRAIVDRYKQKASKAKIIAYGAENKAAFEAVWETLLQDGWFVEEMHHPTLNQSFNLKLLFNVYGLLARDMPVVYMNQENGSSLSEVFGENPNSNDNTYSKDYFNRTEETKGTKGTKDAELIKHIRTIIANCKTKLNDGI